MLHSFTFRKLLKFEHAQSSHVGQIWLQNQYQCVKLIAINSSIKNLNQIGFTFPSEDVVDKTLILDYCLSY